MPTSKKGKVPRQGNLLFTLETPNTFLTTTPQKSKKKIKEMSQTVGSVNFNEFETTLNRAA